MQKLKINIVNLVVGILALTLIGCANNQATEKRVIVGNKNFTEQYIVGQLIKQVLEDNGFKVDLRSDLTSMASPLTGIDPHLLMRIDPP